MPNNGHIRPLPILPSYHLQTFEEMFLTGFIKSGLQIFGPNPKNPTLRYVAFKDAETGNPIHQAILQHEECQRQEQIRQATGYALARGPFS